MQVTAEPYTKPTDVAMSPAVGCYHPHPPLPFIIITQPNTDTHFTGERPNQPRHFSKGEHPVPSTYIKVAAVTYTQLPAVRFEPGISHVTGYARCH